MATRDLEKDLILCEMATSGPWHVSPADDTGLVGIQSDKLIIADGLFMQDALFITAARTGWPETIRYAMQLEEEIDRLRTENAMLLEALNQRGCRL